MKEFFDPLGFAIGLITGLAISLVVGNFWIGLGVGVGIGLLIGPMYKEEGKKEKIKQAYLLTLVVVGLVLILGALALTLLTI